MRKGKEWGRDGERKSAGVEDEGWFLRGWVGEGLWQSSGRTLMPLVSGWKLRLLIYEFDGTRLNDGGIQEFHPQGMTGRRTPNYTYIDLAEVI